MPYNPESIARGIGEIQYQALSNLWKPPSGMDPDFNMPNSVGFDSDMGPYGQALWQASTGDLPTYGLASGTAEQAQDRGLRDLMDMRSEVARETQVYEYGRQLADAERSRQAKAKWDASRAPSTPVTPGTATPGAMPESSVNASPWKKQPVFGTNGGKPVPMPSGEGIAGIQQGGKDPGFFPHAEMIKGYIPEDLRDDPELMKIIAAGSHAESGWDVNRVQQGGGGRGLFQFDVNGGMGTGLSNAQLLGDAGARYQASKIVPQYADWYRKRAQSGLTDPAQIASWVAAQAERPKDYNVMGSAARNNYVNSYRGLGQTPQAPAAAGSGAPYQVNRTSQFGLGLSQKEALAFCGPAAALALTSFYGNNIPVEKVREAATQVGWNANRGMAGPQSQVNLLRNLGVNATSGRWNEGQAQQLLQSGTPLIIDTPGHYFVADQYDPNRGYRVGTSGTDLRGGGQWMTPQQMAQLAVAGAPREMIWRA